MMSKALAQRAAAALRRRYESLAQEASIQVYHRLGLQERLGSVVILDDYFPNLMTGFRISEYNCYLEAYPDSRVYTSDPGFATDIRHYREQYPHLAQRVVNWHDRRYLAGRAAYCVFVNNAHQFLPVIEKHGLPFAFTLYPGGGFQIDDEESDRKLRRVCDSPLLRKVIVTQTISQEYLIRKQFCDSAMIEFVYGGVFPSDVFSPGTVKKRYYGIDKESFDLCFVAHKYMPKGIDKGYDVFIEVARLLAPELKNVRFHVVGGHGPDEIDVTDLGEKIRFYGSMHRDEFQRFYAGMDLIVSPNVPFRVCPGRFDGFPTGCCIEAGLSGVAVFCADCLGSNIAFVDGEELVIIPRDPPSIAGIIGRYHADPERLSRIAANGQRAFARVFDLNAQMEPRLRVLDECLGNGGPH
jgi:glycosyltransferase involved in cell wall biosynthesis